MTGDDHNEQRGHPDQPAAERAADWRPLAARIQWNDHTHHGETETYHILAGEGVYRDNGTDCPAKPGDTFFCEDGGTHGIRCVSQTPLEFMALIIKA